MDTKESICLFCPLGCDIAFRVRGDEVVGPEFCGPAESHAGRVCGRGLYGTELLNHPKRIATPLVRVDGRLRETSSEAAFAKTAGGLRKVLETAGPDAIAVVTEPNRSLEDLRAVGRLARAIGTTEVFCAFEPQDWPLLTGKPDAGVSAIVEASCVLAIGNVFMSHPVLAKEIIEAKYTARGNSLFVVGPRRSNTAWYASSLLQNTAGTEALVLALLLKAIVEAGKTEAEPPTWLNELDGDALAEASGIARSDIARLARSFMDAEKAAIVVAPPARGVADVGLVAALARLVADIAGAGKECVCLAAGGNSRGAAAVARAEGWKPVSELVDGLCSGKYRALVSLGADVYESYPSEALRGALSSLDFSASFSMFHGVLEQTATVVVGAGSWLESDGSAELYDGRSVDWKTIGRPSWATVPVAAGIDGLIAALGAAPEAGGRETGRGEAPDVRFRARLDAVRAAAVSLAASDLSLVMLPAAGQSASGSVTGRIDWAAEMFPVGFAEMSAEDAAALGAMNGDTVVLHSATADVELTLKVTDRLSQGTVAVPSYDTKARQLFAWTHVDGWFETGPAVVRVSRK